MIVRIGENKQEVASSGKYNGVNMNIYMLAAAANNALVSADFVPSFVTVKVILKRRGVDNYLLQDNLQILGTFNTLLKGYREWNEGLDKVLAASGVKNIKLRSVFLDFGGIHEVKAGDRLICEVSFAYGSFTTNVDSTNSNIDFTFNTCQGVETGIFQTRSEVIQTNTTNQNFPVGDNVTQLALLNFDKTDYATEVLSTVGINSLDFDMNYTFNQLLARQQMFFDETPRFVFGSAYPVTGSNKSYRGIDLLPQSFMLYDGAKDAEEIDDVKVNVTFNSANVAASQNYFVWRSYKSSVEIIQHAQADKKSRTAKKLSALPQTV